jgi:hypothetical protein
MPNFGTCSCQQNQASNAVNPSGLIPIARRLPVAPGRPSTMAHRPPVRPLTPTHGSYRRRSGALGALGQVSITGNPTIDSLLENPWTLALGAVALFAAWYYLVPSFSTAGGSLHVKRRRAPTVTLPTAALLGLGGAAAGYLYSTMNPSQGV